MVGTSLWSLFGSPGATTTESPDRMGIRPVTKDARPAVQLACPYQVVNRTPSADMRSKFGVGAPRVSPPPYAPRSPHPTSSPMITMTLGFVCAAAGAEDRASSTERTKALHVTSLQNLIVLSFNWHLDTLGMCRC